MKCLGEGQDFFDEPGSRAAVKSRGKAKERDQEEGSDLGAIVNCRGHPVKLGCTAGAKRCTVGVLRISF